MHMWFFRVVYFVLLPRIILLVVINKFVFSDDIFQLWNYIDLNITKTRFNLLDNDPCF